jgi:ligand-binding SRPBCC domain-containing protein
MPCFELTTVIDAPVERVFDLSLDIDVHTGSMAGSLERAVGGVTSGRIGPGQQVTWAARHFGIRWRMTSVISVYDRPARFVDQMVKGPFATWWHEHRFTADGDTTVMVDVVDYRSPLGPLGRLADRLLLARYMRRLIVNRNDFIKERAEAERDPARPEAEA